MSWLNQFDASGPTWDGNAAAIAEEKRLKRLWEEPKTSRPPTMHGARYLSVLKHLDQEMHALYAQERNLLLQLDQCNSEQEKVRIGKGIHFVRNAFHEIKHKYAQLHELRM